MQWLIQGNTKSGSGGAELQSQSCQLQSWCALPATKTLLAVTPRNYKMANFESQNMEYQKLHEEKKENSNNTKELHQVLGRRVRSRKGWRKPAGSGNGLQSRGRSLLLPHAIPHGLENLVWTHRTLYSGRQAGIMWARLKVQIFLTKKKKVCLFISFSHLHTRCGAQTYHPEIKSHAFFRLSQPGTPKYPLIQLFHC